MGTKFMAMQPPSAFQVARDPVSLRIEKRVVLPVGYFGDGTSHRQTEEIPQA
jgi:hypothetical protein